MNDRLKNANDGAYNNLLFIGLVIGVVYLLVRGWNKSKQITYLNQAGTDKAVQQAQALRDGMNRSGISFLMSVDFTDVDLIMQTATQISDYSAVADAYRVLYPGSELTTDLAKELNRTDLQRFYSLINSKSTGSGSTTTPTNSLVGKTVRCIATANIRQDKAPYGVESGITGSNKQATKGTVLGTYVSEMVIPNVPNAGNRNVFVKYKENFPLYAVYHWIVKTAVAIG